MYKRYTIWEKIWLVFLSSLILLALLWMFDGAFCDSYYYNKIKYRPDCSFKVPEGYSIYYSERRKKYVVRVLQYGLTDFYLAESNGNIVVRLSETRAPTKFDDSCEAKAYLKAYLMSDDPIFE